VRRLQQSWEMSQDEPSPLVVALYVRDVTGLSPSAEPVLPPLDPPVPAEQVDGDVEVASEQWDQWWRRAWPGTLESLLELSEPGLPAFADEPELQALLLRFLPEARAWSDARAEELSDLTLRQYKSGDDLVLCHLVREIERDMRRRAAPFKLRIVELPLAGKTGWVVSADQVIVTHALLADPQALRAWMHPVVAAVA